MEATPDKQTESPRQVRIKRELYKEAVEKARNRGMTFSEYVRYLILKDLGKLD